MDVLKNIFFIKEIRLRIFFTLGMLIVFRIGNQISCPGINPNVLFEIFGQFMQGGILAYIDLFSGGGVSQFSIFALGIMPYISASIIMQLLKAVIPALIQLSKEGSYGNKKIELYTKLGTIILCIIQSVGLLFLLKTQVLDSNHPLASKVLGEEGGLSVFFIFKFILTMTSGAMLLLWIGERISEVGIGNGVSLLIFAGIVARLPESIIQIYINVVSQAGNIILMFIILTIFVVIISLVVAEQQSTRRIPVNYSKRIIGKRMYGAQSTYIPFKINPSGVIPIIFASAVIFFPAQLVGLFGQGNSILRSIADSLHPGQLPYIFLYMFLVVFFAYFYTSVYFNPVELSDRLKKEGGFIPGIRPGINTSNYLSKVLNRITLPGSIFLGIIAVLPDIIMRVFYTVQLPASFAYLMGGTSILIIVGVALDFAKQLESQLLTHNVSGFMSKN